MTATVDGKAQSGLLFGHPKGLYVLSLTETWERFSYYGMRALLVLYLTQRFLVSDRQSFAIYGAYTALVYVSPLLGGMIADRFFGYNKSVTLGAALMIVGHFGLAFQDFYYSHGISGGAMSAVNDARGLQVFYVSMAFLITGVGFLKGNISTMVGNLYPRDSQSRDSGFIIFFWGVNIGATLASFTCGYVGERYGWQYGFGLAGIGMCAGLATFLLGQKHLKTADRLPSRPTYRVGNLCMPNWLLPLIGILLALPLSWALIQLPEVTGSIVYISVAGAFAWAIYYSLKNLNSTERQRMWCAFIVWSIWACYAALIEQTGSSLNLFTERLVDRHIGVGAAGGVEIQSAQFQGLTTLFILLLSPLFAWAWAYLDRRGRNPTTPSKLSFAILSLAAGFVVLTIGTALPGSAGKVSLVWLVLNYLCFSIAAIIIQPIGLSAYTRLSASNIVGFMVGLWMLAVAIGSYLAAQIAKLSALDKAVQQTPAELLAHYQQFFATLAGSAVLLGLIFFALTPLMRRWMHGMR